MRSGCDTLREPAADDAFVHGDLRGRTAWLSRRRGRAAGRACCSSTGSSRAAATPAFDVGTVLAEYLRVWVGLDPDRRAARSGSARGHARASALAHAAGDAGLLVGLSATNPRPPALHAVDRAHRACGSCKRRSSARRACRTPSAHVDDPAAARRQPAARARRRGAEPAGTARMSRYREQVAAALAAVAILGPTDTRGWVAASRSIPASLRGPRSTPRSAGATSSRCLREQLYASFYRHGRAGAGPLGRARAGGRGSVAPAAIRGRTLGTAAGNRAGRSSGVVPAQASSRRHACAPGCRSLTAARSTALVAGRRGQPSPARRSCRRCRPASSPSSARRTTRRGAASSGCTGTSRARGAPTLVRALTTGSTRRACRFA